MATLSAVQSTYLTHEQMTSALVVRDRQIAEVFSLVNGLNEKITELQENNSELTKRVADLQNENRLLREENRTLRQTNGPMQNLAAAARTAATDHAALDRIRNAYIESNKRFWHYLSDSWWESRKWELRMEFNRIYRGTN